jgi:hypothetical protein
MKIAAICFGIVVLAGCAKKDCSSIDLSTLSDIKLPAKIVTQATTLPDMMSELETQVHRTHRLIMRCKSEEDFEDDKVLPGVMLWISDSWQLRNDTSSLGKIFHEHGIDPWERTRVAGILFHRYLNERDLDINTVLANAEIKSEYNGRILSAAALKQLDESEKALLLKQIKSSDSAASKINIMELNIPRADRRQKDLDKTITDRHKMMKTLNNLIRDVANIKATDNDIKSFSDSTWIPAFSAYQKMSLSGKLMLVEKVRLGMLVNEKKIIEQTLSAKAGTLTRPNSITK